MAIDPAFLLYSQDFLTGTYTMTDAQVGKYIRILCLQHQRGAIREPDFRKLLGGQDQEIEAKFETEIDASGTVCFYNTRLRDEARKRSEFCASRRQNRTKGHTKNTSPTHEKHTTPRMEVENENENKGLIKKETIPEIFTDATQTELQDLAAAWQDWKAYKADQFKFKYKTSKTEIAALTNLKNLANDKTNTAISIIQQSIANGWKGLFAIRTDAKPTSDDRHRARVEYANRHNS